MISFGNAASSRSSLIPLKTSYKKRGELLWAISVVARVRYLVNQFMLGIKGENWSYLHIKQRPV